MDIGDPITVSPHLLSLYLQGGDAKREATHDLMETVNASLSSLTVSAPDYETLEFFWTLRRIAKSTSRETQHGPMSLNEQLELARRFSLGYEKIMPDGKKWKDSERVRNMQALSAAYNTRLKNLGLRDYQVAHVMTHMTRSRATCTLLGRLCALLIAMVLWLPMTLLWLPLLLLTRGISSLKARQALASSSVKLSGRDYLATWKLLISLVAVPAHFLAYTYLAGVLSRSAGLSLFWQHEISLIVFFLLPLLAIAQVVASDNLFSLARSLVPLLMISCRPGYADEMTSQREALSTAMWELLGDDLGFRSDLSPSPRSTKEGGSGKWATGDWGGQWRAAHSGSIDTAGEVHGGPDSTPTSNVPSMPGSPSITLPMDPHDLTVSVPALPQGMSDRQG